MGSFDEHVAAARLWAVTRQPYLATALFAMTPVQAEGLGTMGVDARWRLYVDPARLAEWSVEEAGAVLVHEANHLLRDHAGRARAAGIAATERLRWNVAGDCEINDDLGDLPLPGGGCLPAGFGLADGEIAEAYHVALAPDVSPGWGDCGSGAHGVAQAHELPANVAAEVDEGEATLVRQQVAEEVRRLARAGAAVPPGLERWATEFLNPRVDWRRVVAAAVRSGLANVSGRVDYSYARPSRRTGYPDGAHVILPSLVQPLPHVAVVVDTSGSMSNDDLGRALGELRGLLRGLGVAGSRLTVLSCDAAVHTTQRVFAVEEVRLHGGGGTDMGEGLHAAAGLRPKPSLVVVLTDGLTPWPEERPALERIVVGLIGERTGDEPPWADVVEIDA